MKRAVATLAILVSLTCVAILSRRYEENRRHLRLEQQAADLMWSAFVNQYQQDIKIGTTRAEVKKYLESGKHTYSEDVEGREILIPLGDTPGDGLVCDSWRVYASFAFAPANSVPSPQDQLRAISLKKIGHCS